MSIERTIASERLAVPQEHLGVLVEPAAGMLDAMIASDQSRELGAVRLLDTSVGELRTQLRRRFELAGPVILTGHQAEFDHAGVFAKTVAVDALAARSGGSAVFLTVDSDLPRETHVRVPLVERGELRRELVRIPDCDLELPVEGQPAVSAAQWRVFFARIAELGGCDDTLLPSYTEGVFGDSESVSDLRSVIGRGRAAAGRSLGLDDVLDVRMSRLSRTPEVRAFVGHLMLHARRFAEDYNEAQRAYRRRRRVRSPQRPVPLLASDGRRVELPFWVSRAGQVRRRLLVATRGERVELFADHELIGSESRCRLRVAEELVGGFQIEGEGWHLWPRALALSALTRLFLSDLLVHGIGGANYDEMTEDFTRRFFGVDLPPACCVTATVRLPLPRHGVDDRALAAVRHARHDLHFNPQRHLPDLPADLLRRRGELIETSERLRKKGRRDRMARRAAFEQIRAVNRDLLCHDTKRVAELEQQWRDREHRRRSDRIALDREYFFALHPRRTMEELVQRIRAAIA